MKKLDKLILRSFIGPFVLTFAVVVFILLTQHMIKYFDDFVGKDLGWEVFAKLMFYFCLNMTPMALPLAVLISSLMTFGNLGQHFELTAIKSAGISMLRIFLPIFIFVVFLTYVGFVFNNKIVPIANLKAYSLLYDIRQKKPTLDLKEGSFYNGLPGYSIKVNKKFKDGKTLKGVMIYDHTNGKGNTDVILADSGYMSLVKNDQFLSLDLYNGKKYIEIIDNNGGSQQQYVRSGFGKSKIMFSLESFALQRTDEELFATNKIMLSVDELQSASDSIQKESKIIKGAIFDNYKPFFLYTFKDFSGNKVKLAKAIDVSRFDKGQKARVISYAINSARSVHSFTKTYQERLDAIVKEINSFDIERVRKYSQSVAIIIMFLIGAPLGAIIKKGGLGLPILISVFFFVIYYILITLGQKYAKDSILSVNLGMWLPNYILFPIGLFFLRQAKNDSRLLEADFFAVLIDRFKQSLRMNKEIQK